MGALLSWRGPRRHTLLPITDDTTPPWFSNFGEAPPASRVSRLREWRAARRRSTESTAGTSSWLFPRLSSSTEQCQQQRAARRVSAVSVMSGCFGLGAAQRHETSAVTTAHVDDSAKALL